MTDAFERPDTRVIQSARPRISTRQNHVPVSDDGGSRPHRGSVTTTKIARAELRSAHAAEIKAASDTVAAEFASRRTCITHLIEAEFAYKIAAAVMVAPPETHAAIIEALRGEQAAKTAAALRRVASEQKTARAAILAPIRARHAQERKRLSDRAQPTRPTGCKRSSYAFAPLSNQ